MSNNFFERIPAFWQKNVRCTVGGAHGTVNKNFTIAWVSIRRKNAHCKVREIKIAIKIHRKFTSDTPYFFKKLSVVKWKESSKLCLAFSGARKINKKFTFAYPIIRQNFVRLWWGEIQNLDVVIYQAERIYRKFTFATPKFTKKMYVVLWEEKIVMKIRKKFTSATPYFFKKMSV